jgi:hypothetical protein
MRGRSIKSAPERGGGPLGPASGGGGGATGAGFTVAGPSTSLRLVPLPVPGRSCAS